MLNKITRFTNTNPISFVNVLKNFELFTYITKQLSYFIEIIFVVKILNCKYQTFIQLGRDHEHINIALTNCVTIFLNQKNFCVYHLSDVKLRLLQK